MTDANHNIKKGLIEVANNYLLKRKVLVNIGLFVLLGLGAQVAQAVCPDVKSIGQSDVVRINPVIDGGWPPIYYCKQQGFTASQLTAKPSASQLVAGGSQAISMGNASSTIQNFPNSNSIDLAGFTPSQLNLNGINLNFPISGGEYKDQNLFNFYTTVAITTECSNAIGGENKYETIRAYLREHANIFKANIKRGTAMRSGEPSTTGNDLAVIKNVVIGHDGIADSPITADITFYHTNMGKDGQYFTGALLRFCWVGVSTRMDIKTDTNPPKYSGDYVVDVNVVPE